MSTETGQISDHVPASDDICETGECCRVARIEKKVNELHEVVFTMLKGMEEARNSGGMMGMMAKNMLPEIPDLSQYMSNGFQGD